MLTLLRRQDERAFAFVTARCMRVLDGVMRAATHKWLSWCVAEPVLLGLGLL